MAYVTLDGYQVLDTSAKAIGAVKTDNLTGPIAWIPRSVVEDGDAIGLYDKDICVQQWFADKEGLDY